MNKVRNLRSPLLVFSLAAMTGLALAGCDRDKPAATAEPLANAAANVSSSTSVDPNADPVSANETAAVDEAENDIEAMERRHQQAMDHDEMRGGRMEPAPSPHKDSPPAPMGDM